MKTFTVTAIGLALSAAIGTAAASPVAYRHDGYNAVNRYTTSNRLYGSNHRHSNNNAELLVGALLGYAIANGTHSAPYYDYGNSGYYGQNEYYNGRVHSRSAYHHRHHAYTNYGQWGYYDNSAYDGTGYGSRDGYDYNRGYGNDGYGDSRYDNDGYGYGDSDGDNDD